jgi:hypothetical protein
MSCIPCSFACLICLLPCVGFAKYSGALLTVSTCLIASGKCVSHFVLIFEATASLRCISKVSWIFPRQLTVLRSISKVSWFFLILDRPVENYPCLGDWTSMLTEARMKTQRRILDGVSGMNLTFLRPILLESPAYLYTARQPRFSFLCDSGYTAVPMYT